MGAHPPVVLDSTDNLAHINNLQNTAFWALVKSGQSTQEANKAVQVCPLNLQNPPDIKATDAKAKNELLFSQFGINYSHLPARFRKGSTIVRVDPLAVSPDAAEDVQTTAPPDNKSKGKRKPYEGTVGELVVLHEDLIREAFWTERPWLLS